MLVLITGGAASGKSAMGESLCARFGGPLCYVATMIPSDDAESRGRIARHQAMRAGKGFDTVECYGDLHRLKLPGGCRTVLLECVGNLAANELFSLGTPPDAVPEKLLTGVDALLGQAESLVVITNEVFGGSGRYAGETAVYLDCLGAFNRLCAARAQVVVESVCGLPLVYKGKGEIAI